MSQQNMYPIKETTLNALPSHPPLRKRRVSTSIPISLCAFLAIATGWSESIKMTGLEVQDMDARKVKVSMSASGDDVDVGSYAIRLRTSPDNWLPPGFYRDANGLVYLESAQSGKPLLLDNDPSDRDQTEGGVTVIIDTSKWREGRYEFQASACNRPAPGDFVFDWKPFEIDVTKDASRAEVINPSIGIADFQVEELGQGLRKVTIAGESRGIDIGSYALRMDKWPGDEPPSGFFKSQGYAFLNEPNDRGASSCLIDNGPLDEDPKIGIFAYTLDSSRWTPGEYVLAASVNNRPAHGKYIGAQADYVNIKVGDAPKADISNIPGVQHRVVYQKEGVYSCFPDLKVLRDSHIGVSFGTRTRRSHVDQAGGTVSLVSSNEGESWEPATASLIDRRWVTKDGRIVTVDAAGWIEADASKVAELKAQNKVMYPGLVRDGVVAYWGGARARTSSDGGKTWEYKDISLPEGCLGLMLYNKTASEVVTSKGVRLIAAYGRRERSDRPGRQGETEVYILRSDDDGKTWSCRAMYPEGVPNPDLPFNETAIEEAADGTIIAMMRCAMDGPTDQSYLWQAESKDGGLTWSQPVETPVWGYPADLLKLKNGDLLCAYGYRRSPMGIRAVLSHDNGKTWDIKNEMILRNDGLGHGGDMGYPVLCQLADGSILAVYYLTTDGQNTHIASTTFNVPKP